jgi:hypothetical protein
VVLRVVRREGLHVVAGGGDGPVARIEAGLQRELPPGAANADSPWIPRARLPPGYQVAARLDEDACEAAPPEHLDAPVHHIALADPVQRDARLRALEGHARALDADGAVIHAVEGLLDPLCSWQSQPATQMAAVDVDHGLDRNVEGTPSHARDPVGQAQHVEQRGGGLLDPARGVEKCDLAVGAVAAQQRLDLGHPPEGRLRGLRCGVRILSEHLQLDARAH